MSRLKILHHIESGCQNNSDDNGVYPFQGAVNRRIFFQVIPDGEEEEYEQGAWQEDAGGGDKAAQDLLCSSFVFHGNAADIGADGKHWSGYGADHSPAGIEVLAVHLDDIGIALDKFLRFRSRHILFIHHRHEDIPAAEDQAAEAIGILEKVDGAAVGPVIFSGQFAACASEEEDDGKEPDISPFDLFWQDFYLGDAAAAQVGDDSAHYEEDRNDPWPFEQEEGGDAADRKDYAGDGIVDRDFECLLCCKCEVAYGHGSDEAEDSCCAHGEKRKQAHQAAGRKGPDDEGQHSQDDAAAFVTDEGKGLGRRGAGQQLAEGAIIQELFFGDVSPSMYKGLHHHAQMSLGPTKSGEAVKEYCFQKCDMPKQNCHNRRNILFSERFQWY